MSLLEETSAGALGALTAVARGATVVLYDHRLDEGALVGAAERITPEQINFMVTQGCGLVCMPIAAVIADRLGLAAMAPGGAGVAFTVSIDLVDPPTTGISAFDRAACIRRAAHPAARPEEFRVPGHVFPVRARPGGVLAQPGAAEAAADLARLAGFEPAAALCHVMNEDGSMAGRTELQRLAATHGLHLVAIDEIIAERIRAEQAARRAPPAAAPPGADPNEPWLGAVMV